MVKNRYFKNTMGLFAELAIVAAVDASDATGLTGATPATAALPISIAGTPVAADKITITVDGQAYAYTVPATPTTAIVHEGIKALLASNTQGFVVDSDSGTTSSIYNLAWAGTDKNGKTITVALTVNTGASFTGTTAPGALTFAGAVAADTTASDNLEDFVANAASNTIWAFWDDGAKHPALVPGDTANPANKARKFFFAWKDSGGVVKKGTSIPVNNFVFDKAAYNAGTAQVGTITVGGTYANTQILHVRITETTSTQLPYPSFEYSAVITGGNADAAMALIVTQINAEKVQPVVTAAYAGGVLTVTAKDKVTTFRLSTFIETSPSQITDASASVIANATTKQVAPIGDIASVTELYRYYMLNQGAVEYGPEGTNGVEFGQPAQNIAGTSQYGFLLVRSKREEDGVVRNNTNRNYMVIAVGNTYLNTLASI